MTLPSFLQSTLSLAFIICISAVIVMIFMGISPSQELLQVITVVVGAYIGARVPKGEEVTAIKV